MVKAPFRWGGSISPYLRVDILGGRVRWVCGWGGRWVDFVAIFGPG